MKQARKNKTTLLISSLFFLCVQHSSFDAGDTHSESLINPRKAYETIRVELAQYDSLKHEEDYSYLARTLDRAWIAIANVAIEYLRKHEDASPEDLKKEIESLDPQKQCDEFDHKCFEQYQLFVEVLRLKNGRNAAYAIAARYPRFGTFFIVARDASGSFRLAWNIKDVAKEHYHLNDELGYWAYIGFPYNNGPLAVVSALNLPELDNGHARFLIEAQAMRFAGGTGPSQVSVWEWDGRRAKPLFIDSYLTSTATPGFLKFDGEKIRIPTKEVFKTFFSCGMCDEPVGEWTLEITKNGVNNLGRRHVVPELQVIDELLYRVQHGKLTNEIASTSVVAKVKEIFDIHEAGDEGRVYVGGMLGSWNVHHALVESTVCFSSDATSAIIFTIISTKSKKYISEVKTTDKFSC